jgi:hypothetical protein
MSYIAAALSLGGDGASLAAMKSSSRILLLALTLIGCGGTPKGPTQPQGVPSAQEPVAQEAAPSSAAATPGSESAAPESAASAAAPPPSSAEPATEPRRRGAPVDIAVTGKHAGDAAVERIVSGVQTGLQNCYEAGLESAPTAKGVVDFRINVTASGTLKKVESSHPNTMPGTITTCMVGKFGALSFEPKPATTIEVKVTCRPND